MSPLALKNAPFLLFLFLLLPVPIPSAHLLLALAPAVPRLHIQPPAVQIHFSSAGITEIMLISPEMSHTVFLVRKLACQQVDAFFLPVGSTRFSLVNLLDNLQEVFCPCQKHGLTIGLPKCAFAVSKI